MPSPVGDSPTDPDDFAEWVDPPVDPNDLPIVIESPVMWVAGMDDEEPDRCALCGDAYHVAPDPAPGWADLTCPGAGANEPVKEQYLSALAKAYAEHIADVARSCQLCGQPYHREPTADAIDLLCPGQDAREGLREAYLKTRDNQVDRQKIEDADWEQFGDEAKAAYRQRARTDGQVKADMPAVARPSSEALQEHANKTTRRIVRKLGGVGEPAFYVPEATLEPPHLRVKGEVPRKPGLIDRADPPDAKRRDSGAKDSDYLLWTKGTDE